MPTKFPLAILLMELAEELRARDLGMDLEWIKRDENVAADDLSNGKCDAFDQSLREEVRADDIKRRVLGGLQMRSEELYEVIKSFRARRTELQRSLALGRAGKAKSSASGE